MLLPELQSVPQVASLLPRIVDGIDGAVTLREEQTVLYFNAGVKGRMVAESVSPSTPGKLWRTGMKTQIPG